MLAAGRHFRAAASIVEDWASEPAPVIARAQWADPAGLAFDALAAAKRRAATCC